MRNAIYVEPGVLEVVEQAPPTPGPGEVVIDVRACGVCGSDLHAVSKGWATPGQSMGHEVAGVVSELGEGVNHLGIGDRVAVIPAVPCGTCVFCETGQQNLCSSLKGSGGGYADKLLLRAGTPVFRLPDGVSLEEGALLEPLAVAVRGVRLSGVTSSKRCLVVGLGAIGLGVIQVLRAFGVADIIAADLSKKRLSLAEECGATAVIDASIAPTAEQLRELAGAGVHRDYEYANVDIVFECSGSPRVMSELITSYVKPGGTVVMIALFEQDISFDANPLVRKEVIVRGSYAYSTDDGMLAAELITERRVDLSNLISHVVSLDDINDAFSVQANTDESVKVVVAP